MQTPSFAPPPVRGQGTAPWIWRVARRAAASPLTLIAALLAYGNACAWRDTRHGQDMPARFNWAHMAMLAATLVWAGLGRFKTSELGLAPSRMPKSVAYGLAGGTLGSLAIGALSATPAGTRYLIAVELSTLSRAGVLRLLLGQFLFGSALFEEIAFRGLLHARLARAFGPRWALLVGSGVFALWHGLIVRYNLHRLGIPPRLRPALYGGVMGALFASGVALGWLRERTGHIAGSVIAHWLVLVAIVLSVCRPRKPAAQTLSEPQ